MGSTVTCDSFGVADFFDPNAKLLGTFDPSNSGGEVRTEETGIRGFVCKAAYGRQSEVDS